MLRTSFALVACLLVVGGCSTTDSATPGTSSTNARPTATISDPTPVPGGPSPTEPIVDGGEGFVLPAAVCPAPVVMPKPPPVRIATPGSAPIIATPGSSTLSTCSTGLATDTVGDDPVVGLSAHPGDRFAVSVPAGWVILAYDGFDRPKVGEGSNVTPMLTTSTRPSQVEMPIPTRPGRSVVGVHLSISSADGRVVGEISASFQVEVG
jgi:hypothetical protein